MNKDAPPPMQYRLRKLRKGVSFQFNGYDIDGIPQWLIYDEGRNKYFVVGWPEYEMLSHWDLGDPKAIIEAVNKETTLHVDIKDFESLENFLYRNYLVEQRWRSVYQKARDQKIIKGENLFYWFIRYYLFFRVPLFHPDNFLNRTKKIGNILFSPITSSIMLILAIIAIYQIGVHWEVFTHTFDKVFTWQGLFFYFIAFTIAKFFHEFGHAYMSKQYNVSVPTMGVGFLVFWPVLYTDTTQSWSLPSHQRIRIALAGMWVETYVTIIAALVWANVHDITIQMICYITVAINWVSTLLINVSPFMRFDGYYVLSDLLNVPNLQTRSFALARWQLRYWLFGWEDPPPEEFSKRMHWILVNYAFITWLYRLVIYFGIAVLVYHYFFKVAGIILFLIELFAFILRPIFIEMEVWYSMRNKFVLNKRMITTIICTLIIMALLVFPFSQGIKMQATLSYAHQFMYAKQDVIIQNVFVSKGAHVNANQILVQLKSFSLDQEIKKAKLEYEKTLAELRRASLDPNFESQTNVLQSELEEKNTQYAKLIKQEEELNIHAPFNGIVNDIEQDLKPGTSVMKNSWILEVVNPDSLIVEAYVNQSDFEGIKLGDEGIFYPAYLGYPSISVKVSAIEPVNVTNLNFHYSKQSKRNAKESTLEIETPGYQISELGGKIPTNITEEGVNVPLESIYRILLTPQKLEKINNIEVGIVILNSNTPKSYLYNLFYKIKKIFIQESGF